MNVLKSTSSSYVQNVTVNMVLTSYLDKPYFVACLGGYVASIQMMSHNKLKHQVRGQFFLSNRWLCYTMTAKQVNAVIDNTGEECRSRFSYARTHDTVATVTISRRRRTSKFCTQSSGLLT